MYGLTLLVIRVMLFALDAYARREHLYSTEGADEDLSSDRKNACPPCRVAIAILIGLAVPLLAMGLYFAIAVYVVVPFRDIRRLLRRPGLQQ